MGKRKLIDVAGVFYSPAYDNQLLWKIKEGDSLSLVQEPGNSHDKWAIMLIHPEVGMVGYIPSPYNQRLGIWLNQGNQAICLVVWVEDGEFPKITAELTRKEITNAKGS